MQRRSYQQRDVLIGVTQSRHLIERKGGVGVWYGEHREIYGVSIVIRHARCNQRFVSLI